MKKIVVVGCPGSGKSTFSKALAEKTGLPLFHLDMLYWNPDKSTVGKEVFEKRLKNVIAQDRWIIDGNYGSTMDMRVSAADAVFFLDYPLEVCLDGIQRRKGKARSDLPWVEPSDDDREFIKFIKDYNSVSRPNVFAILEKYSEKEIIIFRDRREADSYLLKTADR